MDKSIFGNKTSFGLSALTKKVPAAPAKEAPKSANAGFAADALVRTAAPAAPAGAVADAAKAAELRLAACYDANPHTFARNMARTALEDMVKTLG